MSAVGQEGREEGQKEAGGKGTEQHAISHRRCDLWSVFTLNMLGAQEQQQQFIEKYLPA